MDTEIKSAVNAADKDVQYDERTKRLLGNKIILAHILAKDSLLGSYPWKGWLDLLSTLLSMELSAAEKLKIIENEYRIAVDDRIREDVSAMCNLSQGIREKGGDEREEKIIRNMHKKGYTLEQIADVTEKNINEIQTIIEKREPVLA
ncbi:MAG: hypothetical protein Q4F29_14010 [Lachnospiraceae bacterium]|nr:hypothetical protein [Lachnospiraceae bacterium]